METLQEHGQQIVSDTIQSAEEFPIIGPLTDFYGAEEIADGGFAMANGDFSNGAKQLGEGVLLKKAKAAKTLIRKAFGNGYPTKKGANGSQQPYDPKTGRYLTPAANPGLKYSPASSFLGGVANGYSSAAGKGNAQGPTVGGMPAKIGFAIGYAIGTFFGG